MRKKIIFVIDVSDTKTLDHQLSAAYAQLDEADPRDEDLGDITVAYGPWIEELPDDWNPE